jgi:CDP-diacylglycerol---glycerol-3-phosphate 3-phosphatidyltransferase
VLAIVLFLLIERAQWLACLGVFALAALTDWLDGYLARKQGITSTLGRNLDPLVDKVLICGAYVFLIPYGDDKGWMKPWMVTLVVARELVITSLRSFLENRGATFGADWLGKAKMVLQCAALIAIFVSLIAKDSYPEHSPWLDPIRDACVYGMLATTLLSGLQYLWRAFTLFRVQPT